MSLSDGSEEDVGVREGRCPGRRRAVSAAGREPRDQPSAHSCPKIFRSRIFVLASTFRPQPGFPSPLHPLLFTHLPPRCGSHPTPVLTLPSLSSTHNLVFPSPPRPPSSCCEPLPQTYPQLSPTALVCHCFCCTTIYPRPFLGSLLPNWNLLSNRTVMLRFFL